MESGAPAAGGTLDTDKIASRPPNKFAKLRRRSAGRRCGAALPASGARGRSGHRSARSDRSPTRFLHVPRARRQTGDPLANICAVQRLAVLLERGLTSRLRRAARGATGGPGDTGRHTGTYLLTAPRDVSWEDSTLTDRVGETCAGTCMWEVEGRLICANFPFGRSRAALT